MGHSRSWTGRQRNNVPELDDTKNLLVQAMSPSDRAILAPHLVRVPICRDEVLVFAGKRAEYINFLEAGIVTVGTVDAGRRTEAGILGREGMSGFSVVLGSNSMPMDAATQMTDGVVLRIHADHLETAIAQSPTLRTLLVQFCHTFTMQLAFMAVANVRCDLETRIARWLLMCHDRLDGDVIPLTHGLIARMVGAQRTGVTRAVHLLERTGAVRAARGRVVIRDRAQLLQLVSGIYGQPEAEYSRLIAPFGKQ